MEPLSSNEHSEPAGLNWAGNYRYSSPLLIRPQTAGEIKAIIKSRSSVKALGSRHSFNTIADSPEVQISTENLNGQVVVDTESMTVDVESGLRYGHFCSYLDEQGYALHNLASLPHISVAGACATATHGSGAANKNLAAAVEEIEFVDGTGETVTLNKRNEPEILQGAVVGLGALGIVTRFKLRIEKRFDVSQRVFLNLPLDEACSNIKAIMSSGYSVSLFTTFRTRGVIDQLWIKRRTDAEYDHLNDSYFGAAAADENVHPIRGISAENCTDQLGSPGPWYERLPHFKMGYTPSSGNELQSEYFVAAEDAVGALTAVESLADEVRPYIFTSEIRAIAQDELWLSPAYRRDSIAFHFTWKQDEAVPGKIIPMVENILKPFHPRPHWGKLFTLEPAMVRPMYDRFDDFLELMKRFDPQGKFRNGFLERLIDA